MTAHLKFREKPGKFPRGHCPDRSLALSAQVRMIGLAIFVDGPDLRFATGITQLARLLFSQPVEVHHGDVLARPQCTHHVDIRRQTIGLPLAIGIEVAPDDRGDQDKCRARAAGVLHVAQQVLLVAGLGLGLALRPLARHVIVSELDQNEVGLGRQGRLPAALIAETFGTAPVGGKVDDGHFLIEGGSKTGSPAALWVNG